MHAKVRERLRAGVLPKDLPPDEPATPIPAVRTELGTGNPCAACEEPSAAGEPLEMCGYPSGLVLHFHGWCYKAWNDERAAL